MTAQPTPFTPSQQTQKQPWLGRKSVQQTTKKVVLYILLSMAAALLAIPLFWMLSRLSEERKVPHDLIVGVSAAGMALMATLFVNAWFVF